MRFHNVRFVKVVADLLNAREWPEPAESNEDFAVMILDALAEQDALIKTADDLPWAWSHSLQKWVTVPDDRGEAR